MKKIILSLAATLLFANANSDANKTDTIDLKFNSYQKSIVTTKDGKKVTKWVKTTKVVPGTIIKYELVITNRSNKDTKNAVVSADINKDLEYLPNSIESDVEYKVTFSLDGKKFAPANELKVVGEDGKEHIAKPSDYRAIKFEVPTLPANKVSKISYKTKLK